MKLAEKEMKIPILPENKNLIPYFKKQISSHLKPHEIPIRFVITETDQKDYHCEVGILIIEKNETSNFDIASIFDFRHRNIERTDDFNAVLMIPTGIDAEIGGDSGDGGVIARLIASACDNLITHPNVVNAADINELPENGLYIEGSILSRLLMGTVGLQKVRANRILLAIDSREEDESIFCDLSINAASAGRVTLGLDCQIVKINPKIHMLALHSSSERAVGQIKDFENLVNLFNSYKNDYDALAISSIISVQKELHEKYFYQDMINPWGGVEALLTHAVSSIFNIPSAHSPMIETMEVLNLTIKETDPRKAAEALSSAYLHCILKGLHKSPKIITNLESMFQPGIITVEDISCLIIPDGCIGLPVLAAMEQGIPVIAVKENKNKMQNNLLDYHHKTNKLFMVENYLEAVGVMAALKAGVALDTVRRPLAKTIVIESKQLYQADSGFNCEVEEIYSHSNISAQH